MATTPRQQPRRGDRGCRRRQRHVRSSITYTLGANVETLVLTGTGNINGTGNGDTNTLFGNDGNNTLDGGGGSDSMRGGLGNDSYVVNQVGDVTIESDPSGGTDTVKSAISWLLGTNIENLILTGIGDTNGNGNALNNTMTGNAGKNILNGGGGAGLDARRRRRRHLSRQRCRRPGDRNQCGGRRRL
jgi:Ca2+-binding RTX toxin-like protein